MANITIDSLPVLSTATSTTAIPVDQTGVTYQISSANLKTFIIASVPGVNITGQVANALVSGTVYDAAQPNITSVGTLTTLAVTSNISANAITGTSATSSIAISNYKDVVYSLAYAATLTPNIVDGSIQKVTLGGAVTINGFGGTPQAGQSITMIITQSASGNCVLSSTMLFAGSNKTLSTNANAVDILFIFYDGTTYYATLSKAFA